MTPKACLDTNLLVLRIVGDVRPDLIGNHRRLRSFDLNALTLLRRTIEAATLVTIEPVLAETSNLLASSVGDVARQSLATFIRTAEIIPSEPKAVARQSMFVRFGYTDTALSILSEQGVTIVTEDRSLAGRLAASDLPVLNFNAARQTSY